jgi:ribosomal-protein-alanine N-acetyltransferase
MDPQDTGFCPAFLIRRAQNLENRGNPAEIGPLVLAAAQPGKMRQSSMNSGKIMDTHFLWDCRASSRKFISVHGRSESLRIFPNGGSIMTPMPDFADAPILVRGFHPCDLARLHEIDAICFEPRIAFSRAEMTFYVRQPRAVVRIAECEGKIAGFAMGRVENDGCGHVITIDVLPQARRRGVGSMLLRNLHEEFNREGAALAILEVDVSNAPARAFYERFGYQQGNTLRNYYGRGRDAHRMVRVLEFG